MILVMKYLFIYLFGALVYGLTELAWRGRTHWTMLVCGGTCFCIMYYLSALPLPFALQCVLSASSITAIEFFTGCIVNLRLHWQVWDYSGMRFNLMGQICPLFSAMWLLLSVPGLLICRRLHSLL